jgi:dienelactone hydrolase
MNAKNQHQSGSYGPWLEKISSNRKGEYSFLHKKWKDSEVWSREARQLFNSFILAPEIPEPKVEIKKVHHHDGLLIEELSWALPYGPPVESYFLKPENAEGKLPGVLAFHDHGGNKYFGKSKIADTGKDVHPYIRNYRDLYYSGKAWANELARKGYGVLVHDVFPFESRKIIPSDLSGFIVERMMLHPEQISELTPDDMDSPYSCRTYDVSEEERSDEIDRYNAFAGQWETILAKSLFSAGFTWPGMVLAEDRAALDYLSSREDIDPTRIGCGGLSGGGLRTNCLAGSDQRIGCSVTAGFMTTWADFALHTAFTHTWMVYIPGLPRYMDYPDILSLRIPLPSLVQTTRHDPLFSSNEVLKAENILKSAYTKAGAGERFAMTWYDGPHKFDDEMRTEAFLWFDKWLKKK